MGKVLAIVVTYQAEKWVETFMEALLNSTLVPDIVVVDNNSQDGTLSGLNRYASQIKELISCETNLGFGKAHNLVFARSYIREYDAVLLLNQDASLKPGVLESLVNIMEQNPAYGILSPLHLFDEKKLDIQFRSYLELTDASISEDALLGNAGGKIYETTFVNAAIWLIAGTALELLGGFDPVFPHYGEDSDFVFRIRKAGYKVGLVPSLHGYHLRPQIKRNKVFKANINLSDNILILKKLNQSFLSNIIALHWFVLIQCYKFPRHIVDIIGNYIKTLCAMPATFRNRKIYISPE